MEQAGPEPSAAARWWAELTPPGTPTMPVERVLPLLEGLVEQIAECLVAEHFDETLSSRVATALTGVGLYGVRLPAATARLMRTLVAATGRSDTAPRAARLLNEISRDRHITGSSFAATEFIEPIAAESGVDGVPFRYALENAAVAVAIGDLDGTIRFVNRAYAEVVGVAVESLNNLAYYDLTHPDDADEVTGEILDWASARAGTMRLERRVMRANGEVRWINFSVTYLPQPDYHDSFIAIGEDVTDRHLLQEKLHWQAHHDHLTGLANRRRLFEYIDGLASAAVPGDQIGLCFADLDEFKTINDRFGHTVGDGVLSVISDRLRACSDSEDAVARVGGDEFVVVIPPPADRSGLTAFAERLLVAVAAPVLVGETTVQVTVSIGLALTTVAGQRADALFDVADRALYRAKTDGRRRWAFEIIDS